MVHAVERVNAEDCITSQAGRGYLLRAGFFCCHALDKPQPGQVKNQMTSQNALQYPLFERQQIPIADESDRDTSAKVNKIGREDRAFHDWYRFVLSYPPHLVRDYIRDFGLQLGQVVLDPFCGTGTTVVEAKLQGFQALGLEANRFAHFAGSTKIDWEIIPDDLAMAAQQIADETLAELRLQGIDDNQDLLAEFKDLPLKALNEEQNALVLTNSVNPLPLHKSLTLLEHIKKHENKRYYNHLRLAFANAMVFTISNLHFGPEVGVRTKKKDVPVVASWLNEIGKMVDDLRSVAGKNYPSCHIHLADAREVCKVLQPASVDAVITSPPYPNEKDYTRTTRLESVMLGFITSKADLRVMKQSLVRSNTRNVYKGDDDDKWITEHPKIQRIASDIEKRRIELNKTSGFEKLYGRVTKLYFGGMARHLADLRTILRPGAQLAYVVGDQASYLRVMIRTGELLGDIAKALDYELVRIDLFRTRLATATKEQLREEVVVLRWNGK